MTEQQVVAQRRRVPRFVRIILIVGLAVLAIAGIPFAWTEVTAAGHVYSEDDLSAADAPRADVVLVLGGEVAPDRTSPMPFLRGRLDTAARLVMDGYAKVILVSGDAGGTSGNETAVMTSYLVNERGVEARRIVADPSGLDSYDSCLRAKEVFGVTRALVVTQAYHLSRAVALCRQVGVDADGIEARCDCMSLNLARKAVRDYFACSKAALDAWSEREPAVTSSASSAVTDALARL